MDLDRALAALPTVSAWAPVAGHLTSLMRKGDHALTEVAGASGKTEADLANLLIGSNK